jgi:3-hydroxyisobutyrate dehydrogenase-like beta-hydroxyacid dehydrogenase
MDWGVVNGNLSLGLIGFGEAGFHLAKGLRASGAGAIYAYDVNANTPGLRDIIRSRAQDSAAQLVDSPFDLAHAATVLISVVTAASARNACRQIMEYLRPSHIYADFNSVSPELKRAIAGDVAIAGAQFVEGAIMAPVPPNGHRVPILLNGSPACALKEILSPFGMQLDILNAEIGAATAVKMCRSIVVKGLEALLFECVMAAEPYGAADRVFASLGQTFPGIQWPELASYMVSRVVVHGERRAREMEEVARTLKAAGVEPVMSEATARLQDWAARLDLRSHFGPDGPSTYRQMLDILKLVVKP